MVKEGNIQRILRLFDIGAKLCFFVKNVSILLTMKLNITC